MVAVYIAPEVEQVRTMYPYLYDPEFRALTICQQIEQQAATLTAAHANGDSRIEFQIRSWWPGASRMALDDILAGAFSRSDSTLTICREYGFEDWRSVEKLGDLSLDLEFEAALDAMLAGDISKFKQQLEAMPELATARTRYGHGSTLLHYLGANGVETHRQQTPLNAVELAQVLISAGASKRAKANMYGGGQTPLALASTSAHPHQAGISDALNAVLKPD